MKRNLKMFFGAASLILATSASLAQAAIITSINSAWPGSPDVQTVDANSVTNSNRAISGTRINRQSFSVGSEVTVGEIFLSASNYNNLAFKLEFVEVVDVNSSNLAAVANIVGPIGSTIIVDPQGSTATGTRNLSIELTPAEQFTLPAVAGPGGYMVAISLVDTSSTVAAFNWSHSNTGADIYSGGRQRRDDGNQTNTRDYGLALIAIPEPGSAMLMLTGFAGLASIRRRK